MCLTLKTKWTEGQSDRDGGHGDSSIPPKPPHQLCYRGYNIKNICIKNTPKLVGASKHDRQSIKVHLPWHKRRSWCTWCFWRWVCRCCSPGSWGGCWWKRLAARPQWGSSAARPAPSWRQNLKTKPETRNYDVILMNGAILKTCT